MSADPWDAAAAAPPAAPGPSSEGEESATPQVSDPSGDPNWTREPPQNVDAERAVLGAMLLSPLAVSDVAALLRPDDFYRPAHETIYLAILATAALGIPADPLTVAQRLGAESNLSMIGGAPYLHDLIAAVPQVASATHYARAVASTAGNRRLVEEGTRLVQAAMGGTDPGELATEARARLDEAVAHTAPAGRLVGTGMAELIDDLENPLDLNAQLSTPWPDMTGVLLPFTPGQLIVVGARPSVGKTVFGIDLLRYIAITLGLPAALISMEMSELGINQRILSATAKVPLERIIGHRLQEADWDRVAAVSGRLAAAPLTIEDAPGADLTRIRSVIRRTSARLTVVDYLGLMATRKIDNRTQAVGENVRGLKIMAEDEQTVVVVLAQLNRDSEKRKDGKPLMSDLRESGEVEQAADVVILLHRPELSDPETNRPAEIDATIAKQRNGPTGTVALGFQGHYVRCVSLSNPWKQAGPERADPPPPPASPGWQGTLG